MEIFQIYLVIDKIKFRNDKSDAMMVNAKLLPSRQQPKHGKNGMDNTNNINRFAIINYEIGSRYSATPDPTNDHMCDTTTDPTFEPTFEVYVYNYL